MNLGACGDKCSVCPRYLATVNNDRELFRRILDIYISMGHLPAGFDIELLKCRGCGTVAICSYPDLKKCVASQKLDNCGQCRAYPCPENDEVFVKTQEFMKKLEGKCPAEEFWMFAEAFFRKKEYLDEIHSRSK